MKCDRNEKCDRKSFCMFDFEKMGIWTEMLLLCTLRTGGGGWWRMGWWKSGRESESGVLLVGGEGGGWCTDFVAVANVGP